MGVFINTKSKTWFKTFKAKFPSLQREMNVVVAKERFGPWVSST